MNDKLLLKDYRPLAEPAPREPAAGARRVIRLGRHWAVAVNWKIVSALGLAVLVWALIVAVLASF
ncbi:MAG: hypothetical protein WDO24_23780 [Pseudomonadota bacterium]